MGNFTISTYTEEQRFSFKGRTALVNSIVNSIENEVVYYIYGKSGIGKSSVLEAGVRPKLKENFYYAPKIGLTADFKQGLHQLFEQFRKDIGFHNRKEEEQLPKLDPTPIKELISSLNDHLTFQDNKVHTTLLKCEKAFSTFDLSKFPENHDLRILKNIISSALKSCLRFTVKADELSRPFKIQEFLFNIACDIACYHKLNVGFEEFNGEGDEIPLPISLVTMVKRFNQETLQRDFPIPMVLIFDQFEEIFIKEKLSFKDRCLLENQLKELCDFRPENYNYRIVFSFREDYLPDFQDFIEKIGVFFPKSTRVRGLDYSGAKEVIEFGGGDFSNTDFQERILEKIKDSDEDSSHNLQQRLFNPYLLSAFCLYSKKHNKKIGDIKDMSLGDILYELVYEPSIKRLSKEQRIALLPKFLSRQDNKNFISIKELKSSQENGVLNDKIDGKTPIDFLVENTRLLVRRAGGYLELIHDQLAERLKADTDIHQRYVLEFKNRLPKFLEYQEIEKYQLKFDKDSLKESIRDSRLHGLIFNTLKSDSNYFFNYKEKEGTNNFPTYKTPKSEEVQSITIYLFHQGSPPPIPNENEDYVVIELPDYTAGHKNSTKKNQQREGINTKRFVENVFKKKYVNSPDSEKFKNYLREKVSKILSDQYPVSEPGTEKFQGEEDIYRENKKEGLDDSQLQELVYELDFNQLNDLIDLAQKQIYQTNSILNYRNPKNYEDLDLRNLVQEIGTLPFYKNRGLLKKIVDNQKTLKLLLGSSGPFAELERRLVSQNSGKRKDWHLDNLIYKYRFLDRVGQLDSAISTLKKAINGPLKDASDPNYFFFILGEWAGFLERQGNYDSARKMALFQIANVETRLKDQSGKTTSQDLSGCYRGLGSIELNLNNLRTAEKIYLKSQNILVPHLTKKKDSQADIIYAYVISDLARVFIKLGEFSRATELMDLSTKILQINFEKGHLFNIYHECKSLRLQYHEILYKDFRLYETNVEPKSDNHVSRVLAGLEEAQNRMAIYLSKNHRFLDVVPYDIAYFKAMMKIFSFSPIFWNLESDTVLKKDLGRVINGGSNRWHQGENECLLSILEDRRPDVEDLVKKATGNYDHNNLLILYNLARWNTEKKPKFVEEALKLYRKSGHGAESPIIQRFSSLID